MHMTKMTYAQAESCFYEAYRILIIERLRAIRMLPVSEQQKAIDNYYAERKQQKTNRWSKEKDGNSLIDITKTEKNYEIVPHHSCLNPEDAFKKPYRKSKKQKNIDLEQDDTRAKRGQGIAAYHKAQVGRSARMTGDPEQQSKCEGCIITLPRNYISKEIDLSEEEYEAINKTLASYEDNRCEGDVSLSKDLESALEKLDKIKDFDLDEEQKIKKFFTAAFYAFLTVTKTRPEDVLYAIVHMDESFPHLHIMALPGCISRDTGKFTYSMSKFDRKNFDMGQFHQQMIAEMWQKYSIDASGLLNGASQQKQFLPADLSKQERAQSVLLTNMQAVLENKNKELECANQLLEESIAANKALQENLSEQIAELKSELLHEEEVRQIVRNNQSTLGKMKKTDTIKVTMTVDEAERFQSGAYSFEQSRRNAEEQKKKKQELERQERELVEKQNTFKQNVVAFKQKEQAFTEKEEALKQERKMLNQEKRNFIKLVHDEAMKILMTFISPLLRSLEVIKIIKKLGLKHNNLPLEDYIRQEQSRLINERRTAISNTKFDDDSMHQKTLDECLDVIEDKFKD